MYFNDLSEIIKIGRRTNCAIFVVPEVFEVKIKNAFILEPEKKTVIEVEKVREVISRISVKQTKDEFVIIRPAEKMSEAAANAFLKSLEEPGEKVHFVLVTANASKLLPTILSRAQIYFLRTRRSDTEIIADEKVKALAKKLITARSADLVRVMNEITAGKKVSREFVLNVVSVAIEMLYKSYFLTKKEQFLKKLPKFLKLYDNLEANGHIKLHLVADLC